MKTSRGITGNKWIILVLLMLAYTFSFMDRYIVNLMVEPMKSDLKLTDSQVSLLLGLSFALFYATLGIPAGKIADTVSRKNLIAAGISIWSIMTVCCGLSKTYFQLFLSRMGVGTGEATLSPAAYSIITDSFPKKQWATAISIYSLGIYLGCGIAYIGGGKLLSALSTWPVINLPAGITVWNWQLVFIIFGLPGLLLAIVIALIREPQRTGLNEKNNFSEFVKWFKKDGKLFTLLCIASSLFNIAVYAAGTWLPSYLKRIHHLESDDAGLILGISSMILPAAGILAGGKIADLASQKSGIHGRLKILFFATLLFIPANLFYPFTDNVFSTLLAMIPHGLLISATVGMNVACIHECLPSQYKGTGSAVLLFLQNIIGMGIGPAAVGLLNDYLFESPGAIGKSLLIVTVSGVTCAAIFYAYILFRNLPSKVPAI